jgi:hypothetical protein
MEYNSNGKIYGIPEGISYGQNERVDELNDRLYSRSYSDIPLAPNFDPRPVPTKYSLFPIINRRKNSSAPINMSINHEVEINFNPGTRNAPPAGYMNNIDIETTLRNQTVALQHGADQGVYVPSSKSDLYNVKIVSKPSVQPHPDLFNQQEYKTYIPRNLEQKKIGHERFHNETRTQLRSL